MATVKPVSVPITDLLKRLRASRKDTGGSDVTVDEIARALSLIFRDQLSEVQAALLLQSLADTGLEQRADVLAACAAAMRSEAHSISATEVRAVVKERGRCHGRYDGGLCEIVGTGGDRHSTFNISTTASIIVSSYLLVAKHGNRSVTSKSGAADVLEALSFPVDPEGERLMHAAVSEVIPSSLSKIFEQTNYAFLFSPIFHPGMRYAAPIRKQIPYPTIFNLLGPLAHPLSDEIEARVIGVKKGDLVETFAQALKLSGVKKALVVCGAEDLDEISCAGPTNCARLMENHWTGQVDIQFFQLHPEDFGFSEHALSEVSPGLNPHDNAQIMKRILSGQLPQDDPLMHFVLMNAAALLVISGICDYGGVMGEDAPVIAEVGPGEGRWKEGVRLAREAISSGKALDQIRGFAKVTNQMKAAKGKMNGTAYTNGYTNGAIDGQVNGLVNGH